MKTGRKHVEFLKLGAIGVSRFGSVHARDVWALAATKRMLKKPGCIASAICMLTVNGSRRFLKLVAHSRSGQVQWEGMGGKKMVSGQRRMLTPRCAPSHTNLWFMRDVDAEFQLLNSIANRWSPTAVTEGFIAMHVEYPPCDSCRDVITEFKLMYPQIDVLVSAGHPNPSSQGAPSGAPRCGSKAPMTCIDFMTETGQNCNSCRA